VRKTLLIVVAALAAACSHDIQNTEAVKQGVLNYLEERKSQTGLDPNQMQIDIGSVSFDKDQARAAVIFRPKNQPDPQPMTMNYILDRKGNEWVVRPHAASSGNPHGGGDMTMPQGHPSVGGQETLPPGHPSVGSQPGTLPPGHPAIPSQGSKQ
jgi:hypothetical protein